MYAKVQEPRANGAPPTVVISGSARPGAMALEVNGRTAGQPALAIRWAPAVMRFLQRGCMLVRIFAVM